MEDAFRNVCEVFAIEKLNKHQEDTIKFLVEKKKDVLSICRRDLASR